MATEETTLGVTGASSDSGAALAGDAPTPQDAGTTPSQDVNTGLEQQAAARPDDPLSGVPSLEELETLKTQGIQHAEALHRLRGAYESIKPQYEELQSKFKPLEPYMDRLGDPNEIEQLVRMRENLWKTDYDEQSGYVVPQTKDFAEELSQSAPNTAFNLGVHLMRGQVMDQQTGQMTSRLDLMLHDLVNNPTNGQVWKDYLVRLAGYDPTRTAAPTWEPSPEEIEKVEPDLLDTYKKLPYEQRVELAENGKFFVNDYLRRVKAEADYAQEKAVQAQRQDAYRREQEQVFRQEALEAGNTYIESEVSNAFSGFYNSLVERYKPTTDPALNKKFALITAATTLALSHNETRGPLLAAIKELQLLDDQSIERFDRARDDFAQNAFNYGNMNYVRSRQKPQFAPNGNGNGNQPVEGDLGILKSNASRSLQGLIGQGNNIAAVIYKVLTDALKATAESHNNELDQAETARQVIPGQPTNVTTLPQRQQYADTSRRGIWGPGV